MTRIIWWSIGTGIAIVGLGFFTKLVTVESAEISALRSPDGAADAVLLDVPRDAHGVHSARVCLRLSVTSTIRPPSCTGIAYLSGVSASDRELGMHLEWRSSTELEIRYREATAAYLYYPTFTWPNVGRIKSAILRHSVVRNARPQPVIHRPSTDAEPPSLRPPCSARLRCANLHAAAHTHASSGSVARLAAWPQSRAAIRGTPLW